MIIKIGTRSSQLALTQTNIVIEKIANLMPECTFEIVKISTEGDRNIGKKEVGNGGVKGMFTKEIDNKLITKSIDIAVHSLKDLASKLPEQLEIIAVLKREDPRDVFISNKSNSLSSLPLNACLGTSSIRRRLMLQNYRKDLNVIDFRGNIQTRLNKLKNSNLNGIILALSGLKRLNLESEITEIIDENIMMPAISQGVIGVVALKSNTYIVDLVKQINHESTMSMIKTERSFAVKLEADCNTPLGCFTNIIDKKIDIKGVFIDEKTKKIYKAFQIGLVGQEEETGIKLAEQILDKIKT